MTRPRSANPKSVLLTLRVTPRVRFGLDLLAQQSGRTVSQVVGRAIDDAIGSKGEGLVIVPRGERTPVNVIDRVWSPHEHERVVRLGLWFPQLLNDEQRHLWRMIQEAPRYLKQGSMPLRASPSDIRWDELATDWHSLKRQVIAM